MKKTPSIFKVRYKATGKEKHQTFLSSGIRNVWEDRHSAAFFTNLLLISDHTVSQETNLLGTLPQKGLYEEKKNPNKTPDKPSLQSYSQRYSHIIL